MINIKTIGLYLLLALPFCGTAQEISGGFKTGLNFSKFDGPVLEDANGEALESLGYTTGFHVGAIVNLKFTDFFGLRSELLYSQKGTNYTYSGDSYLRLYNLVADRNIVLSTERNTTISVTNSHVDIPILAYVRLGRFEFAGGVNAAVLLGSVATGEVAFRDVRTAVGQGLEDIIITYDANYFQDGYQIDDFSDSRNVNIVGTPYIVPSIVGGYYDTSDNEENLYRRFDVGLNAQVAFYLNQGLFLSTRLNYGLMDVTNEAQDIDYRSLNNGQVITRDDFDRNFSIQASLGFSF